MPNNTDFTPNAVIGSSVHDAITDAAQSRRWLVNSVIVDKFFKAITRYRDVGDSDRSVWRHGLEQVAEDIVARATHSHDATVEKCAAVLEHYMIGYDALDAVGCKSVHPLYVRSGLIEAVERIRSLKTGATGAGEWWDIEKDPAPKDGTPIDLWATCSMNTDDGYQRYPAARWRKSHLGGAWTSHDGSTFLRPTHWKQLDPPPYPPPSSNEAA